YVYGSKTEADFQSALRSARDLGIALQLTNFLRDVSEDQKRGRMYLPLEMLREHGIDELDTSDPRQHAALSSVVRHLASVAASYYASAHTGLEAFAPDCRLAIDACIKVYGRLNERIALNESAIRHRESVPLREKLQALPPSKYWRIPLAFLTK
ncbi:MAG: squalene/phytoene synthase family protein, partial [Rubrivivax sp.]|nr:squalene/phytoene synthase family protein [Pyrinomonadaceae bacterium]